MIQRLAQWAMALLVSLDHVAQVVIFGPVYLWKGGPCPLPYETISSRVGRAARDECPWALCAAHVIDGLFVLWGEQDHCERAVDRVAAMLEFDKQSGL
jgi:hypothetical protein